MHFRHHQLLRHGGLLERRHVKFDPVMNWFFNRRQALLPLEDIPFSPKFIPNSHG